MTVHYANLFSKSIDLTAEFVTDFSRTFKSNTFDKYTRNDGKVYIKHGVDRDTKVDVFSVEAMIYEYKGCWVGNQKNFGSFHNFADAISCARNVQLPQDSISEDAALALMSNWIFSLLTNTQQQTMNNTFNRDSLIADYAQQILDGMDMKTMECFVYDTLCDNLRSYSDEELIAEVTEYNPELIEGW
jgi:hypothetical protein